MMRVQFISALCVLVFAAGLFSDTAIYIHYLANQSEITELFCENKDTPEMKCNGKCHLGKQLNEHEEREQAPPVEFKFGTVHVCLLNQANRVDLLTQRFRLDKKADQTPAIENGYSVVDLPPPRFI